jgi:hypothetical protein
MRRPPCASIRPDTIAGRRNSLLWRARIDLRPELLRWITQNRACEELKTRGPKGYAGSCEQRGGGLDDDLGWAGARSARAVAGFPSDLAPVAADFRTI